MSHNEDLFQKLMNEGHSAAWDQKWEKAAASYRAALNEFPDHVSALSSLGLALYQLGKFEEALNAYRRVAELSPNDPIAFEKVAEISERLGQLNPAIQAAMQAAELYIQGRDVEKAIENWMSVIQLDPEHLLAHSRLAMVHERLGHPREAAEAYLAMAALFQRAGKIDKTTEMVNHAAQLMPNSPAVKQAQALLRTNQMLPKPVRPKGGTGPIRMAQVKQLEPPRPTYSEPDPISEARQKALTRLASILFDYSEEGNALQGRRGMQAIMKGTGQLSMQKADQAKVILHLSQAIDLQTKNQESLAADELELALEAGFDHAALHFDLGYLRSKGDRLESALRSLQNAVRHRDYALGSRLLMGQILQRMGRISEAAIQFLEALKLADSAVVLPEKADELRQLYEPIIEAQNARADDAAQSRFCENISELLIRPNWQEHLRKARQELPQAQGGELPVPLAEVLIQAESGQVLEAINRVHQYARAGRIRLAMDEAFQALMHAPSYLPLHTLIGDMLVRAGHTEDAIAKFNVVARAYSIRGETVQAVKMLRRILQLAPMDISVHNRLVEHLVALGQVDEAMEEYLDLAEIYYKLAELDQARKVYATALRVAQQLNADPVWNVNILQHMADIDMQRLDWKQAVRVYEQIRTLKPDDETARKNLIGLNIRLGQIQQAILELENYLTYAASNGKDGILLLEELVNEYDDQVFLRLALADQYRRAGRREEAIAQLDMAGERLLENGKKDEAIGVIAQIVAMNPPNVDAYHKLMAQLQAGS
jgi:tetratricopeptide (TPR) repeat protein